MLNDTEVFKNISQQKIMNIRSEQNKGKGEVFLTKGIEEATKSATGWKDNSKGGKLIQKEIKRLFVKRRKLKIYRVIEYQKLSKTIREEIKNCSKKFNSVKELEKATEGGDNLRNYWKCQSIGKE